MDIRQVKAIDVHGHYGRFVRDELQEMQNGFMSGDLSLIRRQAELAGIAWTMVSPSEALTPRGHADAAAANERAFEEISKAEGILQWVVVDPRSQETFEQAEHMLQAKHCVGIKIHPEEHAYAIEDYGDRLFSFAAEQRSVVLTHSGEVNSQPGDAVAFANAYPEARLILAHLGCSSDNDPACQVRALQQAKYDNVYVDTSSAQSLLTGLIEWAVSEVGAERLLFGTDTPLHHAGMMRARIELADIGEQEKVQILCENAEQLFKLYERI